MCYRVSRSLSTLYNKWFVFFFVECVEDPVVVAGVVVVIIVVFDDSKFSFSVRHLSVPFETLLVFGVPDISYVTWMGLLDWGCCNVGNESGEGKRFLRHCFVLYII